MTSQEHRIIEIFRKIIIENWVKICQINNYFKSNTRSIYCKLKKHWKLIKIIKKKFLS